MNNKIPGADNAATKLSDMEKKMTILFHGFKKVFKRIPRQ